MQSALCEFSGIKKRIAFNENEMNEFRARKRRKKDKNKMCQTTMIVTNIHVQWVHYENGYSSSVNNNEIIGLLLLPFEISNVTIPHRIHFIDFSCIHFNYTRKDLYIHLTPLRQIINHIFGLTENNEKNSRTNDYRFALVFVSTIDE